MGVIKLDFLDIRLDMIWDYRELFIRGMGVTLALTAAGYLGGFVLGLFVGMGKLSKKSGFTIPLSIMSTSFVGRHY